MAEKSNNLRTREQLEDLFKDGDIPQEADFKSLIDSMINQLDDGFSKDDENGFEIKLTNQDYNKFISFFNDTNNPNIFFSVEKDEESSTIILRPGTPNKEGKANDGNSFFFGKDGKMGIGKKAEPHLKLEVDGFTGMKGRIGTYATGQVEADGNWWPIIHNLDNCNGFEVIARAGVLGTGKFAMLHAIALATFGRSKGCIRKTSSYYGFFWNKLNLRWKANDTHDYSLQIRSNSHYGNGAKISYKITQLWDDKLFNEQYHQR